MLSNISWLDFGLFLGVSLLIYYTAVVWVYYREEVRSFFKKFQKQDVVADDEDAGPAGLVGRAAPERGMSNVSLDELDFGKEELLQGQLPDCLEELKWFFDQAAEDQVSKEDLPALLRPLLDPYTQVLSSDLSDALCLHIASECKEALSYELTEKEIRDCFPKKGNSGSKLATGGAAILLTLLQLSAHAQDGNSGIQQATTMVKGYFDTGCNLMYAIGAVIGIIGAVKVFGKWNSGEPDTGKVAASWFGSCIFLVVVATVIKSFFGL